MDDQPQEQADEGIMGTLVTDGGGRQIVVRVSGPGEVSLGLAGTSDAPLTVAEVDVLVDALVVAARLSLGHLGVSARRR